MGFSDRIWNRKRAKKNQKSASANLKVKKNKYTSPVASHLLGKGGDVIVEGLGGAHVAVIGHAGEVGVG